jgi:hypothetical protein
MSLKYEPSSKPLHVSAKYMLGMDLFNRLLEVRNPKSLTIDLRPQNPDP